MKQTVLISLFVLSFFKPVMARHITGGEVIYEFVSSTATTRTYVVTLILFRDNLCVNCSVMPPAVSLGVFSNDNLAMVPGGSTGGYWNISLSSTQSLPLNALPNCIQNVPNLSYSAGFYPFTITLPNNNNGYTITYQTCCRIENISNTTDLMGATYIGQIPGNNSLSTNLHDSSPQFSRGISVVCYNRPFTLDFSATDPDGDSLVYSICNAFNGGLAGDAGFATPAPPPYGSIPYTNGYTGHQPLGPLAQIDPQTGIISGIAPGEGKYVVSVCINAYRNGQYIASHRKDFIISVAPCDFAYVSLPESIPMCDSYTYSFSNLVSSPLNQTFHWEFGDGFISNQETPTHTYADTGTYLVKLYVNMGTDCADSSITYAKVYPGFFAGINQNSPKCINKA
ncbi:MAG: PKD domain-containing protein, partial [Ferruginibacter sp.]|nr:PKD domain-containing protein [Ferruginibacter sp.]